MKFDAVIFDLDGTLLDSLEDIAAAANSVLAALGRATYPVAEYRVLVGDGLGMLFERALPDCASSPELKAEREKISGLRMFKRPSFGIGFKSEIK